MNKKILYSFIILTLITIILCGCKESVKTSISRDNNMKVIASIPEEKIKLYASNKEDNMYKGLVLEINGAEKTFNWETIAMIEDLPKLNYLDLNDDGKKELVVILSKGHGTGSSIETVHIINPEDFTEYNIEDPLKLIDNNVEIKILSEKEAEIKINNNITSISLDEVPYEFSEIYADKLVEITYEDYISYEIIDNKLRVTVGVEGDYLKYIGYIVINYSFEAGEFKATDVSFKEILP